MIVALLGGSFDPFHNGHLAMVRAISSGRLADRVLVVPAFRSPHKPPPTATARQRLTMARLALADRVATEVSSLEIDRGGTSYTVDTLEELSRCGEDSYRLVLGADSLAALDRWRRPERIIQLAELIVFARVGHDNELPPGLSGKVHRVTDFSFPVSATHIRAELASGLLPRTKLPASVLDYIVAERLYGCRPGGRSPTAGRN